MPDRWKIKVVNEDFLVREVSLDPELVQENQSHTFLWVSKRSYSTFEAIDRIRKYYNLDFKDVVPQGLKDEDGVTYQLISISGVLTEHDIAKFNNSHSDKDAWICIERIIGYGTEHVQPRRLHGNKFQIFIRDLHSITAKKLVDFINNERYFTYINYYDNQRFGLPGGPYITHEIGKGIISNNWDTAFDGYNKSGNEKDKDLLHTKLINSGGFKQFFNSLDPKQLSFFVSSYNSFIWNQKLSKILEDMGHDKQIDFEHIGKLHVPTKQIFNVPNICICDGFEFEHDLMKVVKSKVGRNASSTIKIFVNNICDDEMHDGRKKVQVSFLLPTGSYATMVIKQLINYLKYI